MGIIAFSCCQLFKIFSATEGGRKGMQGKIAFCSEMMFLYKEEEHFEIEKGIVTEQTFFKCEIQCCLLVHKRYF